MMRVINRPERKAQRDRLREARVKHLLNQIILYANNAAQARSASLRDEHLSRILYAISEIRHNSAMNDKKRRALLRIVKQCCDSAERADFELKKNKLGFVIPNDLDIDEFGKRCIW